MLTNEFNCQVVDRDGLLFRKQVVELLAHPPYFPDLFPNDYNLFAEIKNMLHAKRFGSNEEAIVVTEV